MIAYRERPAEYRTGMCRDLMPKEMLFETGSVTELDDDELDRMITMLRDEPWPLRQEQA